MECDQARRNIEDYHFGELDERLAAEVGAHLRTCGDCRRELASLEAESRVYEAYAARTEAALDVHPETWRRVIEGAAAPAKQETRGAAPAGRRGRLNASISAPAWARLALAAVLLVAVSITGTLVLVNHYRAGENGSPQSAAVTAGVPANSSLESALKSIQRAEQEYLKAIQELNTIVDKQQSTLDPRLVAEVRANIKLIDDRIALTRRAYYAHPEDAELALYMLAAYSRKVELLQDLTS